MIVSGWSIRPVASKFAPPRLSSCGLGHSRHWPSEESLSKCRFKGSRGLRSTRTILTTGGVVVPWCLVMQVRTSGANLEVLVISRFVWKARVGAMPDWLVWLDGLATLCSLNSTATMSAHLGEGTDHPKRTPHYYMEMGSEHHKVSFKSRHSRLEQRNETATRPPAWIRTRQKAS